MNNNHIGLSRVTSNQKRLSLSAAALLVIFLLLAAAAAISDEKKSIQEGYDLLALGKAEEAIPKLESVLSESPKDAMALFYLAEAYRKLNKPNTAKMYYIQSLRSDSGSKVASDAREQLRKLNTSLGTNARSVANPRYIVKGGEAYDKETGLTWARCSVGQEWKDELGCVGTVKKIKWTSTGHQGGKGWRVPNHRELKTLLVKGKEYSQIDMEVFPNMDPGLLDYWTSDVFFSRQRRDEARYVIFNDLPFQTVFSAPVEYEKAVRLVRGEMHE